MSAKKVLISVKWENWECVLAVAGSLPHPRVFWSPHLDGVKGPMEVYHVQGDDWVLLPCLEVRVAAGDKRKQKQAKASNKISV